MKKWLTWLFTLSLGLTLLLAGCTLTEKKEITGEPLDFTVVPAEDVPDELKTILEANKESEMMISYRIGDYLYIIRGYGKQETGGCSIAVDQLILAEDGIHFFFHPRRDRMREKRYRKNPPVLMWWSNFPGLNRKCFSTEVIGKTFFA